MRKYHCYGFLKWLKENTHKVEKSSQYLVEKVVGNLKTALRGAINDL